MIGGNVKLNTKAIVGSHAVKCLSKFRFDKCFIGTNGIHLKSGFTTPDCEEASIKKCAIDNSKTAFVLADSSKFNEVSFVTFSQLDECIIITNKSTNIDAYKKITEIKVVVN
jgi:DeoR family fructose operon transcriptional repressor